MNIKYNPEIGAFVNTETDEKVTQSELLMWTAQNPMEVKVGEPKLTNAKSTDKIKNRVRASKIKPREQKRRSYEGRSSLGGRPPNLTRRLPRVVNMRGSSSALS